MIKLEVPGFGLVEIRHLVADFSGTLSQFGRLLPDVGDLLEQISERGVSILVLTSDTYGTVEKAMEGLPVEIEILHGTAHHIQKKTRVHSLGAKHVLALGNGRNDSEMLEAARLGICVCLAEGCARETLLAADLVFTSITAALTSVLDGQALKASLRR